MDQAKAVDAFTHWFAKHQKKISQLCSTTLLVIIAWIAGQIFWHFLEKPADIKSWQASSIVSNTPQTNVNRNDDVVQGLINAHLFGQYDEKETVQVAPQVVDAPKTRLNLILVGLVTSSDPTKALAVISNRGSQETVGINETISDTRVVLKNVLSDRVIIENAGRNETLMLEGIEYNKVAIDTSSNQVRTSNVAGNNPEINFDDLETIKQALTENPQQFLKYIRLSQVNRDGELLGYRVRPGSERLLFDSVGLQDGDIATELNGVDLTDKTAMTTLFKSFNDMTEIQLTVDRDGQLHEIYVQF
jgi:general secretion pathway protein C